MKVALASRELYPLTGGGIAQYVTATAAALAQVAEVTIFTTSLLGPGIDRLRAASDSRLPPDEVPIVLVPEPSEDDALAWTNRMHCYSARLYEALRDHYGKSPPDLIEFPDYLAEGFIPLQAAETLAPSLRNTRLVLRLHTTLEMCDVLNGFRPPETSHRAIYDMERYCLARADMLLEGGGDIRATYSRFYAGLRLAPHTRVRHPFAREQEAVEVSQAAPCSPLRVLYVGRLERRKGVLDLIRAAAGLDRDDFRLTVIGQDTPTAPLGRSVLELALSEAAGDDRFVFYPPRDRSAILGHIRCHDLVVIPSRWECWPNAALEALHSNRPVLATPVGGLVELVQPGVSGWLAAGTSGREIRIGLEAVLEARATLMSMISGRQPRLHVQSLCNERAIQAQYKALAQPEPSRVTDVNRRSPGPRRSDLPLVSAIVPYYRASSHVWEAVQSLRAQTYPRVEIVVVNDGSFEENDWILDDIALEAGAIVVTQRNSGLGAARNLGIVRSAGRYFVPLDADNLLSEDFIARCVEVLERRPVVAYVTSWSRYIDTLGVPLPGPDVGYEPLGNHAATASEINVSGDAVALLRRRHFDAGFRYSEDLRSFEDWQLYRELRRAGHVGEVIPERLIAYRVRPESMHATVAAPHRNRLLGEMEARMREREVRWV